MGMINISDKAHEQLRLSVFLARQSNANPKINYSVLILEGLKRLEKEGFKLDQPGQ